MNSHLQFNKLEQHGFAKTHLLHFPVLAVFLITSVFMFWKDLSLTNVSLFGFAALFYKLICPAICIPKMKFTEYYIP